MEENNKNNETNTAKGRESLWIIGAFVLMLIAIVTIWQFMLKGKSDEERTQQKDTILQVKTDTVKIKDNTNSENEKTHTQGSINNTQTNDSGKVNKITDKLSEEDKKVIKDKIEELPKKKQDRIKRKIISNIKK